MHSVAVFLASFPFLVAAWSTFDRRSTDGVNYTSVFAPGLSSGASIYFPRQADYNTSTVQRATIWDAPTFAVTIKPANDEDVQYIVKTANYYNLSFFATGGAHGGEPGFATVKQAVNIDLSNLNENSLNTTTNTLTVGPGISFVDFETNLYNAGKLIPVGNAYCVNMIGATIGAGVGPYQGLHGLIIDALLSVRIVTASGDIVTASDDENEDLFWALRGAGANFGIITTATYKVFDAPNNGLLVEADFIYNGSVNASLWELLQSWNETYPKEMGLTLEATYNHTTNQTSLLAIVSFFGPQEAAQPWLDEFVALGPTLWQNQTISWNKLAQDSGFGAGARACGRGIYNNHYSIGANQTAANTYTDVVNQFATFAASRPWYNGAFVVQRFNTTATLAVPENKRGVYPGRDFGTLIVLENTYDGPDHDAEVYAFNEPLRDQLAATSGFGTLRTYINYAFGDEDPEIWYGKKNLPRLVDLKKQWDPLGKFGPGNPVPLSL